MARLLTKEDSGGNVSLDIGKTLGGVVVGLVLVGVAVYLLGTSNADWADKVWTLAVAVITGTLGIAVGEHTSS